MNIENMTVLITGANRGIGRALGSMRRLDGVRRGHLRGRAARCNILTNE